MIVSLELNILSFQELVLKSFEMLFQIFIIDLKITDIFIPKGNHVIQKKGETYGLPKMISSNSFFRNTKIKGSLISQTNIFPADKIKKYASDILAGSFWDINRSAETKFEKSVFPPQPILPHLQNQTKKIFGKMRGQKIVTFFLA